MLARIWPVIGPQIAQVMSTGEATWNENQLVPIFRDGKLEDVYWTYSYSAVRDLDGSIQGTLVTCTETTTATIAARLYVAGLPLCGNSSSGLRRSSRYCAARPTSSN